MSKIISAKCWLQCSMTDKNKILLFVYPVRLLYCCLCGIQHGMVLSHREHKLYINVIYYYSDAFLFYLKTCSVGLVQNTD